MSLQRHEGSDLEALLEDVRGRWGEAATIVEANRIRRGGVAGFFARERFEVVVDPGDFDEHSADFPADFPADLPADLSADISGRLLGLAEKVSDGEAGSFLTGGAGVFPGVSGAPDPQAGISTEEPDFAAVLASIAGQVDAPAPPAVPAPLEEAAAAVPLVHEALVRVGLPENLLHPARITGDPSRWLLGLLEHVPRPDRLPRGRSAVIATVGPRDSALALASELAAELGLGGNAVVLASPTYRGRAVPSDRCIAAPELAAEQRRSWRRRPGPTVVAVESVPGRSPHWARRMLDALEPTMVWGAAEAIRKPEDLDQWAEQMGGFDALAVTGLDDTVSPASVLRCGIPVGRLDGRPATPALWAALLVERVVA